MCMDNLAYARTGYKSFPRSARHLMQLIGSHQSPQTGWAYLLCLSLGRSQLNAPARHPTGRPP